MEDDEKLIELKKFQVENKDILSEEKVKKVK
jgi:hypothetical protein